MWRFTCSPSVHVGFLQVLWFLPTIQKHAGRQIGYATLPLFVNVCMCMVLYPGGIFMPTVGSEFTVTLPRTKMSLMTNKCNLYVMSYILYFLANYLILSGGSFGDFQRHP